MNTHEYEDLLFSRLLSILLSHHLEDYAKSIILTGSFGRNEPTYFFNGESFTLKSDIEIAVVYEKRKHRKKIESIIKELEATFDEDLNIMLLSHKRLEKRQNYNYSLYQPKWHTLFTYDLFNGSKTIWGYDYLKTKVSLDSVDMYEAKRLVANRIGELSYIKLTVMDEYAVNQWKAKVVLAIASAVLLCLNMYHSSYREQKNTVEKNESKVKELLGENFCETYYKAYSFLRSNGEMVSIDDNELEGYVGKINTFFDQLGISNPKTNTLSRKIKYIWKYLRSPIRIKEVHAIGLENDILQLLILRFLNHNKIENISMLWHDVLY